MATNRALYTEDGEARDWEFGTIRSRASIARVQNDDLPDISDSPQLAVHAIRPPAPARLPSSMRHLFGEETASIEPPFSVGNFLAAAVPSTFTFSGPGASLGGLDTPESTSNVPTARPIARNKLKLSPGTPTTEDVAARAASSQVGGAMLPPFLGLGIPRSAEALLPPLGPGIPAAKKAPLPPLGPGIPAANKPALPPLGPGIPRTAKPIPWSSPPSGQPSSSKEVAHDWEPHGFSSADGHPTVTVPDFDAEQPSGASSQISSPGIGRIRSKSSASATQRVISDTTTPYEDAPPSAPPVLNLDTRRAAEFAASQYVRDELDDPNPFTDSLGESRASAAVVHQTAHSFDTSLPDTLHRQPPGPGPVLPPMGRSRSDTAGRSVRGDLPELKDVLKVMKGHTQVTAAELSHRYPPLHLNTDWG